MPVHGWSMSCIAVEVRSGTLHTTEGAPGDVKLGPDANSRYHAQPGVPHIVFYSSFSLLPSQMRPSSMAVASPAPPMALIARNVPDP